jgi:hypothetical protein
MSLHSPSVGASSSVYAKNSNAVALPNADVKNTKSPEIQTLDVIKDTQNIIQKILGMLENPMGFFKFNLNILKDILKAIINIVPGLLKGIWGFVKRIITTIWNAAKNIIVGIAKAIWGGVSQLSKAIFNGIKSLGKWMFGRVEAVYDWTKNGFNKVWDAIKNITNKLGGSIVKSGKDVISWTKNVVGGIARGTRHTIGHLFAKGGYTGTGTYRDSTGERVAGIVHEGEWVAPKWMLQSFPYLFSQLEKARVTHTGLQIPAVAMQPANVNVEVNLDYLQTTNAILESQLLIQKKLLRLLQKFDEEGIKCIS